MLITAIKRAALPLLLATAAGVQAHALFDNPAGQFTVHWHTAQITETYATGVFNTMGLRVDNDPSRARVVRENGGYVLEGIALTFDINDEFVFDTDQKATLEIELDTTGLDEIYVAYDRNGGPDGLVRVPVKAKPGWHSVKVDLERARFANRGYAGTDLAISSGIDMSSRLLRIRAIEVKLRDKAPEPAPLGVIEIGVRDEGSGEAIAAQVGLYDESGRMPLPAGAAIEFQVFDQVTRLVEIRKELDDLSWPADNRYSMYIDGTYRASVPAGTYQVVVSRGPEYEIVSQQVTVEAGETAALEVALEHTLDMPARGWYSGDVHNHFTRENSGDNAMQLAHARAQDLHMHWLNEIGNSTTQHFTQFAFGAAGEYREGEHIIASGGEDPRTDYLGHILTLGQDKRVRRAADYLRYDRFVEELHDADGIAGIAHMDFAQFWQDVALALLVPEGKIDFVEIMQFNSIHPKDWYRFLNMGFRLPAAGGSDWPYMALPGSVRTYVKIDGEFTPTTWKNGLRQGHSFASNGPMLTLSVNGQPMGARLSVEPGDVVTIEASAAIEPTRDLLERIDLIVGGEVVASETPASPAQTLSISHELTVEQGTWVAVQAQGVKTHEIYFQGDYTMRNIGHSSPVYLEVDGLSAEPAAAVAGMEVVIDRLNWFKTASYARNDNEIWESPDRTAELVNSQRKEVHAWVDRMIAWYRERQQQLASQG